MRGEGFAFQLGVELDADKPGVVLDLDDLGEFAVGAHAGKDQPAGLKLVAVLHVDLIAVAVALVNHGAAVDGGDLGALGQVGGIGAQPHGAALGVGLMPRDGVVALHPFLEVVDHGGEAFGVMVEFLGPGVGQTG